MFGLFSAVGVVVGSAGPVPSAARRVGGLDALAAATSRGSHSGGAVGFGRLAFGPLSSAWGMGHCASANVVTVACAWPALVTAAGLPQIRTSIQMMRLFSSRAPGDPHDALAGGDSSVPRFRWKCSCASLRRARRRCSIACGWWRRSTRNSAVAASQRQPLGGHVRTPRGQTAPSGEGAVRRAVINAKLKQRYDVLHESGWVARDGDG